MRKVRIAFLNTHPIQYFAPLYAYLNKSDDLAVSAIYLSDYSIRGSTDRSFDRVVKWDIDLLAGYEARFVKGASHRNEPKGFLSVIAPGVWAEVKRGDYDALVVHGHWPAASVVAIAAAKSAGIPVFMRCETHLGLERNPLKAHLRKPLMHALYSQLAGVLAIGSANVKFYRAMGVPEHRIFLAPYVVDNARFVAASRLTANERAELRRSFSVDDNRPILLFAAKFEERKCPADLLRAAATLEQESAKFQVVMVGSGHLDAGLRNMAREIGLRSVHFYGFSNQSALPRIYAASDVFVLPSKNEPWGLAINEAMCAGLPVVASAEIGCVPDLVLDGRNGLTFPAGDVGGLTNALRKLLKNREMRVEMGHASREMISRWSFADVEDGVRAALMNSGVAVLPITRSAA